MTKSGGELKRPMEPSADQPFSEPSVHVMDDNSDMNNLENPNFPYCLTSLACKNN